MKAIPYIVILLLLGFIGYDKLVRPLPSSLNTPSIVKEQATIRQAYRDSLGANHAVILADENIIRRHELRNPEQPLGIVDTAAKLLKIARDQIQSVTKVSTATKDSLLQAKKVINQLTKRLELVYQDKYVALKYTPNPDTALTGTFDFAYNADLNIVQYSKRSWFLGQKKSLIDISSNDPRTTIMGVKRLTVEQQTPAFGARLRASATYNPGTESFSAGPEASIDLGRFQFRFNYYYNMRQSIWRPTFTSSYDLIRF